MSDVKIYVNGKILKRKFKLVDGYIDFLKPYKFKKKDRVCLEYTYNEDE